MLTWLQQWLEEERILRKARKAILEGLEKKRFARLVHTVEFSWAGIDELYIYDHDGKLLDIEAVFPGLSQWGIAYAMTQLSHKRHLRRDFKEIRNKFSRTLIFQEQLTSVS